MQIPEKVTKANKNWWLHAGRMACAVEYSRASDTLFVSFGEAVEAFAIEVGEDPDRINLRVAFDNLAIIGWDVEDFTKFLFRHPEIAKIFRVFGTARRWTWKLPAMPAKGGNVLTEAIMCFAKHLGLPGWQPSVSSGGGIEDEELDSAPDYAAEVVRAALESRPAS